MTKVAKDKVNIKLTQLLLVAETLLVTQQHASSPDHPFRDSNILSSCTHCFQLMAIDVIFNSKLEPFIIDVNIQPSMKLETVTSKDGYVEKEGKILESSVRKSIIIDTVTLISSDESVATDVTDALEEIVNENVIGIMGVSCQISHEICLGDQDLNYLLDTRRQDLNLGGFEKLYPSPGMSVHKQLLDEIGEHFSWTSNSLGKFPGPGLLIHRTADLYPLLKNLERFYYGHLSSSGEEDSVSHSKIFPEDHPRNKNWTLFNQELQCSEGTFIGPNCSLSLLDFSF